MYYSRFYDPLTFYNPITFYPFGSMYTASTQDQKYPKLSKYYSSVFDYDYLQQHQKLQTQNHSFKKPKSLDNSRVYEMFDSSYVKFKHKHKYHLEDQDRNISNSFIKVNKDQNSSLIRSQLNTHKSTKSLCDCKPLSQKHIQFNYLSPCNCRRTKQLSCQNYNGCMLTKISKYRNPVSTIKLQNRFPIYEKDNKYSKKDIKKKGYYFHHKKGINVTLLDYH